MSTPLLSLIHTLVVHLHAYKLFMYDYLFHNYFYESDSTPTNVSLFLANICPVLSCQITHNFGFLTVPIEHV